MKGFYLLLLLPFFCFGQTAEKHFEMAKKSFPNYATTMSYLGKAIYKDADNSLYYLTRAKVRFTSGKARKEDMERDLKKALELDPENPYIYVWLAKVMENEDQYFMESRALVSRKPLEERNFSDYLILLGSNENSDE